MVKLYISEIKNKNKPDQSKIKKISSTILNNIRDVDLELFAKELTEQGKTVMLAQLSENILSKRTPIVCQELVMLDFDNNGEIIYTIDDLINDKFMTEHALFYYKTFSDSEKNVDKFRVVFKLNKEVHSNIEIENIYKELFKKYPQADISVGQTTRLFFGSNSGYYLFDWSNRLIVNDLESNDLTEVVDNDNEIFSINTPVYRLLKYKQYDLVKQKWGNKYSQEFPDEYSANNYFCSLPMQEVLELPNYNPFFDIFHYEKNKSASIFYSDDYGQYFYKCFSEKKPFTGDLLRVILKLTGLQSKIRTILLLVDLTDSKINYDSELGMYKKEADLFRKNLTDGTLSKENPFLYSLLKRYTPEINATLDLMFDYAYKDRVTGEVRYLSYFSVSSLQKLVSNTIGKNISERKMWNVLSLIVVTEMVTKLKIENIPKELYDKVLLPQVNNEKQLRISNVYEPNAFTDVSMSNMDDIAKVLKENNVKISSLSYELVYRLFGEEKANKDFPQAYEPLKNKKKIIMSKEDINLPKKSLSYEKLFVDEIMNQINQNGYCIESKMVASVARSKRIRKANMENNYAKCRADICSKYGLKRKKLTKELYSKFSMESKYSPKIILYK